MPHEQEGEPGQHQGRGRPERAPRPPQGQGASGGAGLPWPSGAVSIIGWRHCPLLGWPHWVLFVPMGRSDTLWASSCRYLSVKSLPEALSVEDEEDLEEKEEQDHHGTLEFDGPATAPEKAEATRVPPRQHPAQIGEGYRAAIQ